jgi:hypothetical protein
VLLLAFASFLISGEFFGAGRHYSVILSKALGGDMGLHCAFIFNEHMVIIAWRGRAIYDWLSQDFFVSPCPDAPSKVHD